MTPPGTNVSQFPEPECPVDGRRNPFLERGGHPDGRLATSVFALRLVDGADVAATDRGAGRAGRDLDEREGRIRGGPPLGRWVNDLGVKRFRVSLLTGFEVLTAAEGFPPRL